VQGPQTARELWRTVREVRTDRLYYANRTLVAHCGIRTIRHDPSDRPSVRHGLDEDDGEDGDGDGEGVLFLLFFSSFFLFFFFSCLLSSFFFSSSFPFFLSSFLLFLRLSLELSLTAFLSLSSLRLMCCLSPRHHHQLHLVDL
jgi:hypothetical protein